MIDYDYQNINEEFDPFLDDAEIVELGRSKELLSDELYMPIHLSRDWVRCYVTTTQPDNFRLYVDDGTRRFLLSAKRFNDVFLISTYEDFPVVDIKPRRGYVAKVEQKKDLSYLVSLNYCHLCDEKLEYFTCGRCGEEREVIAKVVHSVKKYNVVNMEFRCLSVTLPFISDSGMRKVWCPRSFRKIQPSIPNSADVNECLYLCPSMGMRFVNKLPEWNAKVGSLVLKFQGERILTASAKNFLLYDEKYSKYDFAESKVRQQHQQSTSNANSSNNSNSVTNEPTKGIAAQSTTSFLRGFLTGSSQKSEVEAASPKGANGVPMPTLDLRKTTRTIESVEEAITSGRRSSRSRHRSGASGSRHRSQRTTTEDDNSPMPSARSSVGSGASPLSSYRSSDNNPSLSPPNTGRSSSNALHSSSNTPREETHTSSRSGRTHSRRSKKPPRPRDAADVAILQFGKSTPTRFVLDFKYPLSPVQAFGIALSTFGSEHILRSSGSPKKPF